MGIDRGGDLSRARRFICVLGVATSLVCAPLATAAHASGQRTDLKVLVVTDGGPATEAISHQLATEGVPYTTIDLNNPSRATIDDSYLAGTVGGVPEAKYQAVVLPNENPFGAGSPEMAALVSYEQTHGIRQVDAYTWANPGVGLNYATYLGSLDGVNGTATSAGTNDAFRYLAGPVAFEDNDPGISESYGYLATPLADDPAHSSHFEPLVTAPIPGTSDNGSLVGAYTHDGRAELVTTFVYNFNQQQYRLLAHGIVTWMTKGVHLGYNRNYFAVHVDDVFAADSRWSVGSHCTPGDDCPLDASGQPTVSTTDIRMVPADVTYAKNWQQDNDFTFDLMFNGTGSDDWVVDNGSDPLTTALVADKTSFRWVNHTYSHEFLGCIQDFTVVPWRCVTNPTTGAIEYMPQAQIQQQISQNITFANNHGLPIEPDELVTGEHSGMYVLPQQPADNPALAPAFAATGIAWAGADASREPDQRQIGSALTIPRHPMNVFYNVATPQEEAAEYNWLYTSRANGGSGVCEDHPDTTTCISPLNTSTGYTGYIVPIETRIALSHILANDPDPHYIHQSNLAENRIIYPVLDSILTSYRGMFAGNAPIVNMRMSGIGEQMKRNAAWKTAAANGSASGYVQDGVVTVDAPSGLDVPVTVPEGTHLGTGGSAPLFGDQYAGERSAWARPETGSALTLALPA